MKRQYINEIRELLKGKEPKSFLFHFRDVFREIVGDSDRIINPCEVDSLLSEHPDTDLFHFFKGAIDPIPEAFKGRKVLSIQVDSVETAECLVWLRMGGRIDK